MLGKEPSQPPDRDTRIKLGLLAGDQEQDAQRVLEVEMRTLAGSFADEPQVPVI